MPKSTWLNEKIEKEMIVVIKSSAVETQLESPNRVV